MSQTTMSKKPHQTIGTCFIQMMKKIDYSMWSVREFILTTCDSDDYLKPAMDESGLDISIWYPILKIIPSILTNSKNKNAYKETQNSIA